MSSRHTSKLARIAAPYLRDGESVEIGAFATVGAVSLKRQFLTTAIVGVASAGMIMAAARPAKRYLAVTSDRLLFFDGEGFGPGKLLFSVPRNAVAVTRSGQHLLTYRIDLAVAGQEKGLRMNFPLTAGATVKQITAMLPAAGTPDSLPQAAAQAR